MIYDIIIIGSGPAGMTAGIYAARREMKTLIIGKELGGQVIWASEIENYPGFKHITNYELIEKMSDQVKCLGVEIKTGEVQKIEKKDDIFVLTVGQDTYEARTILVAMGLIPRRLAIKGETELTGKGVSYCANCDGPFFRNKPVAVIGGGNAALDAAEILSKICSKVYLVHRSESFRAFDALVNEVKSRENIEILLNTDTLEVLGDTKVSGLKVKDKTSNQAQDIVVDGVFIEIGRVTHTDLFEGLIDRDEKGQIIVNEKCQTSHEGIFAAGDVTPVPFKQITVACGQGTIAALSAYEYLQSKLGGKANVIDRGRKASGQIC